MFSTAAKSKSRWRDAPRSSAGALALILLLAASPCLAGSAAQFVGTWRSQPFQGFQGDPFTVTYTIHADQSFVYVAASIRTGKAFHIQRGKIVVQGNQVSFVVADWYPKTASKPLSLTMSYHFPSEGTLVLTDPGGASTFHRQ